MLPGHTHTHTPPPRGGAFTPGDSNPGVTRLGRPRRGAWGTRRTLMQRRSRPSALGADRWWLPNRWLRSPGPGLPGEAPLGLWRPVAGGVRLPAGTTAVPGCAGIRPAAPPTPAGTRRPKCRRPWRRWRRASGPGPRRWAALGGRRLPARFRARPAGGGERGGAEGWRAGPALAWVFLVSSGLDYGGRKKQKIRDLSRALRALRSSGGRSAVSSGGSGCKFTYRTVQAGWLRP